MIITDAFVILSMISNWELTVDQLDYHNYSWEIYNFLCFLLNNWQFNQLFLQENNIWIYPEKSNFLQQLDEYIDMGNIRFCRIQNISNV